MPHHGLSRHKIWVSAETALLRPPPSGTNEFALVITLAGCRAPRVTNFCIVHNASLRTLARSCSGSAVPLYLACGAVGRVRCVCVCVCWFCLCSSPPAPHGLGL